MLLHCFDGKWKIVGSAKRLELYAMETDRCELQDLASQHPEKVKELQRLWQAWSDDCARSRKGRATSVQYHPAPDEMGKPNRFLVEFVKGLKDVT